MKQATAIPTIAPVSGLWLLLVFTLPGDAVWEPEIVDDAEVAGSARVVETGVGEEGGLLEEEEVELLLEVVGVDIGAGRYPVTLELAVTRGAETICPSERVETGT
jgi:hypothetical protein